MNKTKLIMAGTIAFLAIVHAALFLTGYRLSADDVMFHLRVMGGLEDAFRYINAQAVIQGRVTHFIDLAFALPSSYYADMAAFRLGYTALYFSTFALAALYISRLTESPIGWLTLMVMLSLHPLDYYHLSPNAFPLLISLPVFLILGARIKLMSVWVQQTPRRNQEVVWLVVCLIGMSFGELVFVFAMALMVFEAGMRWAHLPPRPAMAGLISTLTDRRTRQDALITAIFLGAYFWYRLLHPSRYDGNQIGDITLALFLKTLVGHIAGGTTLSAFVRYAGEYQNYVSALNTDQWRMVAAVFASTGVATFVAMKTIIASARDRDAELRRYGIITLGGLTCALIVTTPVAITHKYQAWCNLGGWEYCLYLDSRLSFFGLAVAIAGLIGLITLMASKIRSVQWCVTGGMTLLVASTATASFINNHRLQADMRQITAIWDRANGMACMSDEARRAIGPEIAGQIDPEKKLQVHAQMNIKNYWDVYMKDRQSRNLCN